ncbi:ribonuclease catalytic domain-containing protein [Desulfopila aestuarii]|uniref:Exoribonuclease-2 n=1 Tax=Desulfopila aestuarii DSM 18488 TaxID=1121416 RepID=A0A1M7Y1Q3_9BACT|nr:ribonuclease catalytic domain-containing protein [Desulfopila aestuarii]SHO45581.1 exoribonuclease-2 [Desulfopila aestuarii DSM 18488]
MIQSGKLIEYLDNGKFICGFVTEAQPKRVRLINQNGREVLLPISRIVHCSRENHTVDLDREILIRALKETTEKRNNLMGQISLEEIWELTSEENVNSFQPEFLAELSFGQELDDDIFAAFLRCIFFDKLFFRYKEGLIKVHSAEQVEQLRQQREKEMLKAELILKGAQTIKDILQHGSALQETTRWQEECLKLIRDYYLFANEAENADIARHMLKEAGLVGPHDAFDILVKAGVWSKNENIPLLRSSQPVGFSLPARQQAENILQSRQEELFADKGRLDLTHLRPITIDGATTLDFDDALTIEKHDNNYLVGIHISDVAHYVRPGDPLFQEAMQRGTSIYFPEGQIPMLPRHLSQGICSLIQGETRATFSFIILLSEEAEVLRVRVTPSIIRVARRLTYEEADKIIDTDEELRLLNMLKKKLRQKRLDHGALLLPFPDVNIFIDLGGKVHVSLGKTDTPARTLISEMMILANSEAARYISDRMVPGLFRCQPPLRQRIVHGEDDDLFLNIRQRKQLPRGELLTEANPHSGLGVSHYTTVTSPIRRLLDLVMQHQLHSVARRREPCFTSDMCRDFSTVITRTLTAANNVKQQRHRYWLLKYLQERKGQLINALVIESGPKRVNMVLTDLLMDVDLATPAGFKPQPGSMVKLRITRVSPLDNTVKFDW